MCTTKSLLQELRIHPVPVNGGPDRWVTIFGGDGLASLDWAADSEGLWATLVGEEENALLRIDLQGHAVRVWRPRKIESGLGYSVARWPIAGAARRQRKCQRLGGGAPFETRERAASPSSRRTPGSAPERRAVKSRLQAGRSRPGLPPAPAATDPRTAKRSPEGDRDAKKECAGSATPKPD